MRIAQLGIERRALGASAQVLCHPRRFGRVRPLEQQPGKQAGDVPRILAQRGGHLLGEPLQPQPGTGAPVQGGDGVRLDPELGRDPRPLRLLDLGQPEHALPPRRERLECGEHLGGSSAILEHAERVLRLDGVGVGVRIDEAGLFAPAHRGVAHRGEEIGAEGALGAVARYHDLAVDGEERLGGEILGAVRHEPVGDPQRSRDVAPPELGVGIGLACSKQ